MTKLDYKNYIKDKNFDLKNKYCNLFESKDFDNLKNKYPFNTIFFDINFEDIIFSKVEDLTCLINKIELRIIEQSILIKKNKNPKAKIKKEILIYEAKDKIKEIFKYEGNNQSKKITPFFTDNFDFRTCFYCNKDFITNFDTDKKVSTFQLDHFFDKATYPYLALSFYNLIPSCATCNSKKVKGSANTFENNCIAPNSENFDFHQKVKFKLLLDDSCKNLHIKSKDDIDITLKEQFTDIYDKYIEIFKLNERYKAHKNIVFDMIQKAELYPQSRLKELENLTGIPFQQIKKDIFNLIDENEDLSKQPFSKLMIDMSKELGIL
ncbi:HNH endonuclease [Arcobacter cloacae]|uniref:HNH endonuclease n=1 Tax=Arcobacter cloacae TaxID=1054034 RepID=A0A4Q0ZAL8_9BACT|nr:hypothetical protein [Arcobacter cloacae]RXJ83273.1 hypothetical protein CRU90_10195 [Arcobacter cloacae]